MQCLFRSRHAGGWRKSGHEGWGDPPGKDSAATAGSGNRAYGARGSSAQLTTSAPTKQDTNTDTQTIQMITRYPAGASSRLA